MNDLEQLKLMKMAVEGLQAECALVRLRVAQADKARQKADPFDQRVKSLLSNIERRRGVPVPKRDRAAVIAAAILREDGGNIDSIRRSVRRSLDRTGLR